MDENPTPPDFFDCKYKVPSTISATSATHLATSVNEVLSINKTRSAMFVAALNTRSSLFKKTSPTSTTSLAIFKEQPVMCRKNSMCAPCFPIIKATLASGIRTVAVESVPKNLDASRSYGGGVFRCFVVIVVVIAVARWWLNEHSSTSPLSSFSSSSVDIISSSPLEYESSSSSSSPVFLVHPKNAFSSGRSSFSPSPALETDTDRRPYVSFLPSFSVVVFSSIMFPSEMLSMIFAASLHICAVPVKTTFTLSSFPFPSFPSSSSSSRKIETLAPVLLSMSNIVLPRRPTTTPTFDRWTSVCTHTIAS